jgi:hypothetical protein
MVVLALVLDILHQLATPETQSGLYAIALVLALIIIFIIILGSSRFTPMNRVANSDAWRPRPRRRRVVSRRR